MSRTARTLGILLFDGAEELDWAGPWEVLTSLRMLEPDTVVLTIAEREGPITCAKGLRVLADATLQSAPALDVVLVPGGQGTRVEVDNPVIIEWLRKVGSDCEWVTSVCSGTLLLHEAGFARGKRVTTHWGFADTLEARGDVTVVRGARWVRDGNLVTSAGVSAGIDMALWLVGQMHSPEVARKVQRYMEYDPAPPYQAEV